MDTASTVDEIVPVLLMKQAYLHGLIPVCSGCGHFILSHFLLRISHQLWHEDCFRCSGCGRQLTRKCYPKDGRYYCRDDFLRVSKTYCNGCRLPVYQDALVHKARGFVYHVQCFRCSLCSTRLTRGDEYYLMNDGTLLCKTDYEMEILTENCPLKRPRTAITSEQLRVLKQAYKIDPKPAKPTRERLSKETGLQTRVVQVWFQNRRAKDRRKRRPSTNVAMDEYTGNMPEEYHANHRV